MSNTSKHERYWYVLYTRPRFEKKVDLALKRKELHSFLPLCSTVGLTANGKRKIEKPLFPSYVFVFTNLKEQFSALRTYGVARFVMFNGEPAQIPELQIENVRRLLGHPELINSESYLDVGDFVEIVCGPFAGVKGKLIEHHGSRRVLVGIDLIQQAVSVNVDLSEVKKIEVTTSHFRQ